MTTMSMAYDSFGRTEQKGRTRSALVAAARRLVASGVSPTVEQAATAAAVSRTTAYRYFPSQAALLAAAHPETAARSMLGDDASPEPAERLDEVESLEQDGSRIADPGPLQGEPQSPQLLIGGVRAAESGPLAVSLTG